MKKVIIYLVIMVLMIVCIILLKNAFNNVSKKASTDAADVITLEGEVNETSDDINSPVKNVSGFQLRTKDGQNYSVVKYMGDKSINIVKDDLNINPNIFYTYKDHIYIYDITNGLQYIDLDNNNEIKYVDNFNNEYSKINSLIYILDEKLYFANDNNLISFDLNDSSKNILKDSIAWNGYYLDSINKKIYYVRNSELYNCDLDGNNEKIINPTVNLSDDNSWLGIINNNLVLECYDNNKSDETNKKLVIYDINNDSLKEVENVYSCVRCDEKIAYVTKDDETGKNTIKLITDITNSSSVNDIYTSEYHSEGIHFGTKIENYDRITMIWYDKTNNIIISMDDGNGISNNGSNIIKSYSLNNKGVNDYTGNEYVKTMLYR